MKAIVSVAKTVFGTVIVDIPDTDGLKMFTKALKGKVKREAEKVVAENPERIQWDPEEEPVLVSYGFSMLKEAANVEPNEEVFHVTDITWDTDDGEDYEPSLPTTLDIKKTDLLYQGESANTVDDEILADRIADYLSDKYGWLVEGYALDEPDTEEDDVRCTATCPYGDGETGCTDPSCPKHFEE